MKQQFLHMKSRRRYRKTIDSTAKAINPALQDQDFILFDAYATRPDEYAHAEQMIAFMIAQSSWPWRGHNINIIV